MGIRSWYAARKQLEKKHRTDIVTEESLSFDIVCKLRVAFLNSRGKESIYLALPSKRSKLLNKGYYHNDREDEYFEWISYKDIFTEEKVCDVRLTGQSMTPGVEFVRDEDFKQYLLQYNEAHNEYSLELLKQLLKRIKNDHEKTKGHIK